MEQINNCRSLLTTSGFLALLVALLWMPVNAHGKLIYDTWTSDNSNVGSYVVTVEHNTSASTWDFVFTVLPWDAEGRGLFVDLGDYDLTDTPVVSNVSWYPTEGDGDDVDVKYTDKDTYKCGKGCTIKDLDPPLPDPDDEWELVFELADKGYDSKMGARPLGRVIQEYIKKPLAEELLFGTLAKGGHVKVGMKKGELDLQIEAPEKARISKDKPPLLAAD